MYFKNNLLTIKKMNKKLNYAWLLSLLMIFSITFVSCSKDDDEDSIKQEDLIGTWKGEKEVLEAAGDSEDQSLDETIEFKNDGTYTLKEEGFSAENGKWTLSGSKLKIGEDEYNASISGKKLTLTSEDELFGVKIKSTKTYNKQ